MVDVEFSKSVAAKRVWCVLYSKRQTYVSIPERMPQKRQIMEAYIWKNTRTRNAVQKDVVLYQRVSLMDPHDSIQKALYIEGLGLSQD